METQEPAAVPEGLDGSSFHEQVFQEKLTRAPWRTSTKLDYATSRGFIRDPEPWTPPVLQTTAKASSSQISQDRPEVRYTVAEFMEAASSSAGPSTIQPTLPVTKALPSSSKPVPVKVPPSAVPLRLRRHGTPPWTPER